MSPPLTKNASENFVVSVTLIALTSSSVLTRLALKLYRRQVPQGPDWMCFIATGIFTAYGSLIINFIFNVSQYHALDPDPRLGLDEATNLAKLAYTSELLFGFGITTIKLSILWFYHNLFSVDQTLQRVIYATAVICIAWFIVATLVIALQCMPVQAYWEHFDLPPYCLEYPRVLLGYEISNLLIDVAILCIPTGTVIRLQLPWLKKVPIIGIFLLGAVVCVFSIIRLKAIWNPPNIFAGFDFGATFVWSTLQLGVAIITSCLPTFGPLLIFFSKPIPYIRSWYESLRSRQSASHSGAQSKTTDAANGERPWVQVGDDRLNVDLQSWASGEDLDGPEYVLHPVPSRAILVNRVVEVV
ncbi:hypothetical protein EKO27_g7184 [Xylaria grammica]|uniref:Rhodopsin domain-containing protein n=1 Tax=Xylaria grammica TaxID=363999 RepID=A0A439D0E2_9PEZI|nr:hypothetical protein EKO27_g7184 [Xylaria grammica]